LERRFERRMDFGDEDFEVVLAILKFFLENPYESLRIGQDFDD
jgi:hypothetical protein